MIITIYDVKLSVFLELVAADYECQGYREGIKVFNVDQIRYDGTDLLIISNRKSIIIRKKDFSRISVA